jgi:capsular exopolysaccharide synthesis family protein
MKKKGKRGVKQKHERTIFELLMFRFLPYWPLFALLTAVMILLAWLYLQVATPVYEIKATLLIKDEKKGVENSTMVESLNILTSKKIVENEIEVIKSRRLMRETIGRLHLCAPVFEEGLFSPIPAYSTSPVSIELMDADKIIETERVDFSFNPTSDFVTFNDQDYKIDEWINSPFGQIRFVRNKNQRENGIGPFYVSFIDSRKVMKIILDNLAVEPSNKLATVVNLSLRDVVPVRGENILNTLIERYNNAAINDKNSLANSTLEFVEARIKLVERDLDSLERSIQTYKSAQGIVDLGEQGRVFLKNVGENDQRLSEIDIQLAVLAKVEDYVSQKDVSSKLLPSTLGINDEGLSILIQKLYESELRFDGLKRTIAPNNPILLSLQNEISSIRSSILENIRNQKLSLSASRTNLALTNSKYASALTSIPRKERELLEANRLQSIKNNVYTFLLQKREEAALSSASSEGDSRIVDAAESSIFPVAPKRTSTYGAAIAVAWILGFAWVMWKDVLNRTVLFRSEIESSTDIPVVAEIIESKMKNYVVVDNLKQPFMTEQFTRLRAAVGLYGNSTSKSVMITSSIGGEGKSFISTNFAISLAGTNKKVLLIDIDLRNPRVSSLFNTLNVSGISEFLLGHLPIEKVVLRTAIHNLFLIGAGKKRTDAIDVLLDGNFAEMFARLRMLFDYIVIDTPPVTPVADAYVISPCCDQTLFIVRHGTTPKQMLQLLDGNSRIHELKNLSIVFNGVRERGIIKTAYEYGYGQAYGGSYPA